MKVGIKKVIGKARDEVANLSRFHIRQQAPEYQPLLVEQKFRLELPGTHDLVGIVDLYDANGVVTDFKTRSRRASQVEADKSPQLYDLRGWCSRDDRNASGTSRVRRDY